MVTKVQTAHGERDIHVVPSEHGADDKAGALNEITRHCP